MKLTLTTPTLEISANTEGAELCSVKKNGTQYLWQAGDAWKRYAPILFPFICSPKDKRYKADGKEYIMPSNHGFARDREFEALPKNDNSLSFRLKSDDESLKVYPYDFELTVRFTVRGDEVEVLNSVKNTGSRDMYFYLGGHPAFNCPLEDGLAFDDYEIRYGEKETIVQPLLTGGERTVIDDEYGYRLTRALFDHDVIMKDKPNSKTITLMSEKSDKSVTLRFPESKCIAVWSSTGNDDARFVCLEPWTSVPVYCDDEFEDIEKKPHAIRLAAGAAFDYRYFIGVK
ncbi:MAG: aldose 1-epimerase family protein [Ruminococcus sp.]|nr:aldose 1-epimerase family protein [Ruminococcus sp.]